MGKETQRTVRDGLASHRRLHRVLFTSPAEARFVELMGGVAFTLGFIRSSKTGFPLTWLWLGPVLKRELIEREVQVGPYSIDFATPNASYKKGVEIDGTFFHQDIVREQNRDDYLRSQGWSVLHIPARRLWRDPRRVRADVLRFLKS